MNVKNFSISLLIILAMALAAAAQDTSTAPPASPPAPAAAASTQDTTPAQNQDQVTPMDQTPTFKVNVVGRTTKAVNYHFRSGATKVDLKGTDLMPNAHGTARVESHPGRIGLDVTAEDLDNPQIFGTEYLTYVLW